MARYEFTLEDIASPKLGNISEVFGAGGGTQIQFGTSVFNNKDINRQEW